MPVRSDRGRDEMLLSLSPRGEALTVAGALRGRSVDAAPFAGRGFFQCVHVADRPTLLAGLADALESGRGREARLRLLFSARDAQPAYAWTRVSIHPAAEGRMLLARVTGEAGRARAPAGSDRFLANVSHELRTPLNAILGFSELLADGELAPRDAKKQREYARIIHESAAHLLSLVNLVLDASKVEAGKFELNPESFSVGPLIESCCDMVRLKADIGGVDLKCASLDGLGSIVADKRAVKQIVANLLSNAVKFTPSGGQARVAARRERDMISLVVEDTGVGIPEDLLDRVGEPFFQAHAAYDRPFEGAGLGFSLVRGLVALHGGALTIESSPGAGTSVTVRLPVEGPGAGAALDQVSARRPRRGPVERARTQRERSLA